MFWQARKRNAKEIKKRQRISEKLKSKTEGEIRSYLSMTEETRIKRRLLRLFKQGKSNELAKEVSRIIKLENAGIGTGMIIESTDYPGAPIHRRFSARVDEDMDKQFLEIAKQGDMNKLFKLISCLKKAGIDTESIPIKSALQHILKQIDNLDDVCDSLKDAKANLPNLTGKRAEHSNKISLLIEEIKKEKGECAEIIKILKKAGVYKE